MLDRVKGGSMEKFLANKGEEGGFFLRKMIGSYGFVLKIFSTEIKKGGVGGGIG